MGGTAGSGEPSQLSKRTWLEVDQELQKAMYVAIELLKMLRRVHRDPRPTPQIRAEITAVAQWINLLIEQREQIAVESTEQAPDLVKLGGRLVCHRCRQRAKDKRYPTSAQEDLATSPIWKTQLGFLLACTKRVGTELFAEGCASYSLRKIPDCLAKLMEALLRQRRYLASRGGGEIRIAVEHCSTGCCAGCGQPIEPPLETVP